MLRKVLATELESVHILCGANWPCPPPTEALAVCPHTPPPAKPLPCDLALKPVDHAQVMLHSESLL